ncbi:MAG: hypothetical protein WAV11_00020 [Minisyncoccia bacterium]
MTLFKTLSWIAIIALGIYIMQFNTKLNISFTVTLGVVVFTLGILGFIWHLIKN